MNFYLLIFVILFLIVLSSKSEAREFFVAADGHPDNDGSREKPLDMATALSSISPALPGDTIWLLGGIYKGGFTSRLKGKEGSPITVRQYPGQRAVIDCISDKSRLFSVEGEWTEYWDFEVLCSDPKRITSVSGSSPQDIDRGGINCQGSYMKFINLIIHDTAGGFGFWSGGEGGEIYGCIIYNNGWKGPDRGHGHAIYAQNQKGVKRLVDNIMFNQFSHGIHVYGSSRAFLRGFHIEGNVSFNNGSLAGEDQLAPNILVGGGSPAGGIAVINNYTYHTGISRTSVRLGYGAVNDDVIVKDNYFAGHTDIKDWQEVTLMNNTFICQQILIRLKMPEKDYTWDKNTYYSEGKCFVRNDQAMDFGSWQINTGFDRESQYFTGKPAGVKVFIRPNRYEAGRAHIIVYNWDRRDSVEVDLKGILEIGKKFKIVNAQDYFGDPVTAGIYDGKSVNLPMNGLSAAQPIGETPGKPPATGPEFNVFVVVPD